MDLKLQRLIKSEAFDAAMAGLEKDRHDRQKW
jgi:hypothetical protein